MRGSFARMESSRLRRSRPPRVYELGFFRSRVCPPLDRSLGTAQKSFAEQQSNYGDPHADPRPAATAYAERLVRTGQLIHEYHRAAA